MTEWRAVGDTGWLLDVVPTGDDLLDARRVLGVARRIRAAAEGRVVDVVPAAATVLVTTTPRHHAGVGGWLAALDPGAAGTAGGAARFAGAAGTAGGAAGIAGEPGPLPAVTIGVRFDGADLAATAELTGRSVPALVAAVTGVTWTAAFTGFVPGFAYLVGGGLDVARLPSPRPRVPAGSLALAGRYAGVYPRASPGGWRLVGHVVDAPALFDAERTPPALIPPGASVRFVGS